jgi:hypothetical protein
MPSVAATASEVAANLFSILSHCTSIKPAKTCHHQVAATSLRTTSADCRLRKQRRAMSLTSRTHLLFQVVDELGELLVGRHRRRRLPRGHGHHVPLLPLAWKSKTHASGPDKLVRTVRVTKCHSRARTPHRATLTGRGAGLSLCREAEARQRRQRGQVEPDGARSGGLALALALGDGRRGWARRARGGWGGRGHGVVARRARRELCAS